MTDEVLEELWTTKERIAKEYGYRIEDLAEYYLRKQAERLRRFQQGESTEKVGQRTQARRS